MIDINIYIEYASWILMALAFQGSCTTLFVSTSLHQATLQNQRLRLRHHLPPLRRLRRPAQVARGHVLRRRAPEGREELAELVAVGAEVGHRVQRGGGLLQERLQKGMMGMDIQRHVAEGGSREAWS